MEICPGQKKAVHFEQYVVVKCFVGNRLAGFIKIIQNEDATYDWRVYRAYMSNEQLMMPEGMYLTSNKIPHKHLIDALIEAKAMALDWL